MFWPKSLLLILCVVACQKKAPPSQGGASQASASMNPWLQSRTVKMALQIELWEQSAIDQRTPSHRSKLLEQHSWTEAEYIDSLTWIHNSPERSHFFYEALNQSIEGFHPDSLKQKGQK